MYTCMNCLPVISPKADTKADCQLVSGTFKVGHTRIMENNGFTIKLH